MNGMYIRALSPQEFGDRCLPYVERALPPGVKRPIDAGYLRQIAPLVQERAKTLSEVPSLVDFFFTSEVEYDRGLLLGKLDSKLASDILGKSSAVLEKSTTWNAEQMEAAIRPLTEDSMNGPFSVYCAAATGRSASPPLFQTMGLGEVCLARLQPFRQSAVV
jgi:glutamyl-tRNA synthetase